MAPLTLIEEHTVRHLVTSVTFFCGLFAVWAVADESNLQVLPLHLTRPEILEVMRLMTVGLGTECTTCHSSEQNDYRSDELPAKRVARAMMREVEADRPGLDWAHPPEDLCSECHEGALRLPESSEYAGSSSCRGCHTLLYERWRETRHARSILSAEQAHDAGYPLPERRPGGQSLAVKSWDDVLFVFGGKQRVAYVNQAGRVEDSAFHHRLGEWRSFPHEPLVNCAGCHATSARRTGAGPVEVAWEEPDIGCEACHGPGARHTRTVLAADIRVDPSPRSCGQCHTLEGAVLPRDDRHLTHDFVQVWHRDAHFTGVSRNSHSAFCARCHSPYEGLRGDNEHAIEKQVYSEAKHGVSCVGCHDPHQLSSPVYAQGRFQPLPPQKPRRHLHLGHDSDFTTVDYAEAKPRDEFCLGCHKGVDRIDLDHGNARCNDCHIRFQRNRSRASTVNHDANEAALGCRSCHANADHLMTILFRDPDFLETRNIHNLRTLPQLVIDRYGFRYPDLPVSIRYEPRPTPDASVTRMANPPPLPDADADAASDREAPVVRQSIRARPARTEPFLSRAAHALAAGNASEARRLVVEASRLDDTSAFMGFPLDDPADASPRADLEGLRTLTLGDQVASRWFHAYLDLTAGRFEGVGGVLGGPSESLAPSLAYLGGIAAVMANDWKRALDYFDTALASPAGTLAPRVAKAVVELRRNHLAQALVELDGVRADAPSDPIMPYLSGWAHLRRGDAKMAIADLERAVALAPEFDEAHFALARAHKIRGDTGQALRIYSSLIQRKPSLHTAHAQLGQLFKYMADQVFFRIQQLRDESPTGTLPATVESLEAERSRHEASALAELAVAVRLDLSDVASSRHIGEILRRRGELDQASVVFRFLLQRQPGQSLLHYRLGSIAAERQDVPAAVSAFSRALDLAPADGDSYQALGIVLLRAGNAADAQAVLERGSVHQPFNPALHNNLGVARARTDHLQQAQTSLERALELGTFPLPRRHVTHYNLALVQLELGDPQEAELSLQRALHARPEFGPASQALARVRSGWQSPTPENYLIHDLFERFGEISSVALSD